MWEGRLSDTVSLTVTMLGVVFEVAHVPCTSNITFADLKNSSKTCYKTSFHLYDQTTNIFQLVVKSLYSGGLIKQSLISELVRVNMHEIHVAVCYLTNKSIN